MSNLLPRMRSSSLHQLARSVCATVRGYDGREDCVVVQTAKFVFTWELLMNYSARVTSNRNVTFYSFWCAAPPSSLPGERMPGV